VPGLHLLCCTIGDQRSGMKPGQVHVIFAGVPEGGQTTG